METGKVPSMLTLVCLLLCMNIINQSSFARTLGNSSPSQQHHKHHKKITFQMQNVLNLTHPLPKPATTKVTSQIPFPKPLGYFPPSGGIPIQQSNPTVSGTGLSTQTLDVSNIGLSFPARATLQELEFGSVTEIDEDLFVYGSLVVGKAQGVYVASSEDGTSHMMAITTKFVKNKFKDGLRFFGVHKTDVPESHIAVIGGTGKYHGANGYAVIRAVGTVGSKTAAEENRTEGNLLFNDLLLPDKWKDGNCIGNDQVLNFRSDSSATVKLFIKWAVECGPRHRFGNVYHLLTTELQCDKTKL
ncbi:unnamed protein product [Dovyalis caffra]|uniref:Dirigent protein n=1 Tax=Dovyalis caffra TaxID=77055 RepID=A0AAV1QVX3_9ROSI|nr:unnamed protein product [Dovyalis caffra]